jgi:outer membrane protein OmpA-like peptidoglycan-associated protein
MHDHDREAILARRALFISTALAGFACTTHEPSERPDPQPQHAVSPTEVEGDPLEPPDGTRPPWSEIMAAAPPLEVPQGLTKNETELLSGLESSMRARYAELEKVWSALPNCAPSQTTCEDWATTVSAIMNAEDDFGPLCGYSAEVTNTFIERERVHTEYLRQVGEMLLADLDAAAKAFGDDDVTVWNDMRTSMLNRPMPCLSCAAPTLEPVIERVSFEDGRDVLAGNVKDEILTRVVQTHQANRKTKLVVRGHADPGEADADGLAKRRAEAVAAALIQLGVRSGEIEVRSYGAKLPLTREAGKAGQNRRVDFEVVGR